MELPPGATLGEFSSMLNSRTTERDHALAEVKRLRAALKKIHDFPYVGAQASERIRQVAREALGDRAVR